MKPPYYHTMWSEYGRENSTEMKLMFVRKIADDFDSKQAWLVYFENNPHDERAQFVVRNFPRG